MTTDSEDDELRQKTEEVSKLESQLRSEHRITKELTAKIAKLDSEVADLHKKLEQCMDEGDRKDDWVRRLETLVHELHNQQEQAEAHYVAQLQDRDTKIAELKQALEGQRATLQRTLTDHSSAGISLSQTLEKERREWTIEREMLRSELYGSQQLVHEYDMVPFQFLQTATS